MPVGGSQVLSRWRPRRRSPSHPLYILQTASGQLDGHNSYGIVGVVFVTGRGGASFHFVIPPLLRPGVNSLPFLPAPYDMGPWPGCGARRVFYFPR